MEGFFATGAGPTSSAYAVNAIAPSPQPILPFLPPPPLARMFIAAEITFRRPSAGSRTFAYATAEAPTGAVTLRPFVPELNDVIRASDAGYITRSSDPPGQVVYSPTLAAGWALNRTARLEPWSAAGAATWGTLSLISVDGRYDAIFDSSSPDGRPVRLLRGTKTFDRARGIMRDPSYTDLVPLFVGVGNGLWRRNTKTIDLDLRDPSYQGERPIQTNIYAGTGTYEGTAQIKGQAKPFCRGGTLANPVLNVSPVLVDPVANIWQVNDGPFRMVGLYEGAYAAFTNAGDTGNLYAGTTPSGSYRTDQARGFFQLGFPAKGTITADVVGYFPSGVLVSTAATITQQILTETLGIDPQFLELGSLIGLDAARPYTAGVFLTDSTDAMTVVDNLLRSVNAWLAPGLNGKLRGVRIQAPGSLNPSASYGRGQVVNVNPKTLPDLLSPPPFRIRMAHSLRNSVQTSDWDGAATDARKQLVADQWSFEVWLGANNIANYRIQNDPPAVETPLLIAAEALASVNELGAIFGVRRSLWDLEMPMYLAPRHEVGEEIILEYPDAGIRAGTRAVVIGNAIDSTRPTFTLSVMV